MRFESPNSVNAFAAGAPPRTFQSELALYLKSPSWIWEKRDKKA